jgi:hypothetical protein
MHARRRAGRALFASATLLTALAFGEARAADDDDKPALPPPRATTLEREPPTKPVGDKPQTEHNEFAGAPILGGNTDIGFQIGVAATFTRVSPRYLPYRWKIDGLISASVKDGPRGTEVVQQSHDLRLDMPRAVYGKVRIMPGIFFERTVNAGYFGIGNATPAIALPDGSFGSRYQYIHREIRARVHFRQTLAGPNSIMYGLTLRNVSPST